MVFPHTPPAMSLSKKVATEATCETEGALYPGASMNPGRVATASEATFRAAHSFRALIGFVWTD